MMLDVVLGGGRSESCDGASRRDFLRVGALGALGLSLPAVLRADTVRRTGSTARAKSVILVFLGGGLSHLDSFDPKPEAPEEIRGKYRPIPTVLPGVQVGGLLPRMAKVLDRLTLIRSGSHNNDHHETATNWVLSGRFGSPFGDYPALGAVVAHQLGARGTLPPYVAVPRNPSFTWELGKSAFLGSHYEPFKAGDPNDEVQQRVSAMPLSSEARQAFAVEKEPDWLHDRYGQTTFGQSCLLARRLVEGGVRFVTVNDAGWDHHAKIFANLDRKLPEFDQGFSALIEDLDSRGMLAETLVLALSEFSRTPTINSDAGRDHWGQAASLLFGGAGVKRGQVIGATDKTGAFVTCRPVSPADVACTVLDAIGIDPRTQLVTLDGRAMEILDQGEVVRELFA